MIAINSLEFISYINNLKPGSDVTLECPQCQASFTRKKNVIQSKFGKYNNEKTIYCSKECWKLSKITLQEVKCLQCTKLFNKCLNQTKKFPNHFCSRSCSASYNNTHKTHGTKRSKLEIWLEQQLTTLYPNLDMIFNQKETIDSELDIYIPSLKLAIELNGIFHYEPIYGTDKLAQIKNNDNRKFQACLERGIEFVIIDTSHQKYFKESTSIKYLDIIKNIINLKLF